MTRRSESLTKATLNNGKMEEIWEQINGEVWMLISTSGNRRVGCKMKNRIFEKYVEQFRNKYNKLWEGEII